MENTKLQAYPTTTDNANEIYEVAGKGFTKLEMASLMIAQGIMARGLYTPNQFQGYIAEPSVSIAKALLEEANK